MKIKTRKQADNAYESLHQFYRDDLARAKGRGSWESLSEKLGVGTTVVRNAIIRDSFNGLRKLVERLK